MTGPTATKPTRRSPIVWLATGLGFGFSPIMPGTVGALWGLPLAWGLAHFSPAIQAIVLLGLLLIGVPLCTIAARELGAGKDPGAIVWDEIITVPMIFILVEPLTISWLALGFVLHRAFDIAKVPPARQLERLPQGWGIMADDVAAAIYAGSVLMAVIWITK